MARVNYSFEKRKRELERKSKKAAKAEKRAQEGGGGSNDGVPLEPLTGPNTSLLDDDETEKTDDPQPKES